MNKSPQEIAESSGTPRSLSLFGVLGIALSMPLLAIGRVVVLRLYVEDWLGDKLD